MSGNDTPGGGNTEAENKLFAVIQEDDTVTYHLNGEFDLTTSSHLQEPLLATAEDPAVNNLILDFEKVTFVDATFLGLLTSAAKKHRVLEGGQSAIVIRNPNLDIRKIFEIICLDRVFQIEETRQETAGTTDQSAPTDPSP